MMRHAYIGLLITACAGEPFSGTEVLGYDYDGGEDSNSYVAIQDGAPDSKPSVADAYPMETNGYGDSAIDALGDVTDAKTCYQGESFQHCAPKAEPACPAGYHAVSVCDCDNKPCYPLVTLECVCNVP